MSPIFEWLTGSDVKLNLSDADAGTRRRLQGSLWELMCGADFHRNRRFSKIHS